MVLELALSIRVKDTGAGCFSDRDFHSSTYPVTCGDTSLSHLTSKDVSDWGWTLKWETKHCPKITQQKIIIRYHCNTLWTEHMSGISRWECYTFYPIHFYKGMIRAPHCINGSQVKCFNLLGETEKAVVLLCLTQSHFWFPWFNSVQQIPAIGMEIFGGLK